VGGDRLANPGVEAEGPLGAVGLVAALDAQDVGPLVGEVVGILRRVNQPIDELVALVGGPIGEEGLHLLGRGQRAREVVLGAAGDVLDAAVAVVGVGGELLLVLAGHDTLLGMDRDARDARIGRLAQWGAGGDPAADEAVLVGVGLHALAAAVGHGAGRLE